MKLAGKCDRVSYSLMKPHRIFIAINLPESVKDQLLAYREKWQEIPARWTTKENLHLTLAFLGNTSDQELAKVCDAMKQVGSRHKPFALTINRIVYGPDAKRPRMIWGKIRRSPELFTIQEDIASLLSYSEKQPFAPHLTLARLKTFELQRMELEELPEVNEEISLSFQVESIEIMESKLKRSGAEYSIIQSVPLRKTLH